MKVFLSVFFMAALLGPVISYAEDGCKDQTASSDVSLSHEEASKILGNTVQEIIAIRQAEVPGLWEVHVKNRNRKFPLYIDSSKSYIISGNIFRVKDKENITRRAQAELNRVDYTAIPVEDALIIGSPDAKIKAIVVTDPQCPYCKRLHEELKEAVFLDPEIAFLIKLYPLKMHPKAYDISKSILCEKSLKMLDDSLADRPVPPPTCETDQVDKNIALVKTLGITSTPTLITPEGLLLPGYKKAAQLLKLLGSDVATEAEVK